MATPDRDNLYTNDPARVENTVYTRERSGTGWFVGIIVALALLAIGYLIFSANSGPGTAPIPGDAAITTDGATMTPADGAAMAPAAPATDPALTAPAAEPVAPVAPAAEPAPVTTP